MRLLSPFLTRRYLGIIFRTCKRTCSFFSQFLGHRLPMTSRLELGCVRPSVRTSTKSFSDLHLIWYVGRPRPDMRINVTSTQSKVKVMELPKLRKLHFSRSFSAVLVWSSKLMAGSDSMGPGLQLIGARFFNFLVGNLSREFKLRPMSIVHEIQMAIFR